MKKSVSPPHYQMDNSGFDDFDPRLNFSKFLEEAKHNPTEEQDFIKASTEEETARKWLAQQKKSKKSWKNTLFSWLKIDKKTKPEKNLHTPNKRRVHVSGPIYTGATTIDGRPRHRPTSGPIASLLRTEMEIPYMCLHQLTSPNINHNYGPIYLVT